MYKKNDKVTYNTGSAKVRGFVTTVHKDGSLTVKAMFYVGDDGKDIPGYLGFNYRVWPNDLQVGLTHAS
jgi:hypothetical protein